MNTQVESTIAHLIKLLEIEDALTSPDRTVERVALMYNEIFSGVGADISDIMESRIAFSQKSGTQMVSLSSVSFFSTCEHHFLPFYGFVDVSFVPGQYIIGLGKLTSLIKTLAKKPQLQEKYTREIADSILQFLDTNGVAVHVIGRHLCEAMRGNKESNQVFSTFIYQGIFETDLGLQTAFMNTLTQSPG